MPVTYAVEAHFFLSKGRAKFSLDYLKRLLQLGADPFRDPFLEGLEGNESLIYASRCHATLVLPAKPLPLVAPNLAKGLVRLLMACPKPTVRLGQEEQLHFFSKRRKVRWQIRLATRPNFVFRLGEREFFAVIRLYGRQPEKEIWIGVLGRKKKRRPPNRSQESGARRQKSAVAGQDPLPRSASCSRGLRPRLQGTESLACASA